MAKETWPGDMAEEKEQQPVDAGFKSLPCPVLADRVRGSTQMVHLSSRPGLTLATRLAALCQATMRVGLGEARKNPYLISLLFFHLQIRSLL